MTEPFLLRANLVTAPTISHPVHLDGLLLSALERRTGRLDLSSVLDCVEREDGVYRASAGVLVTPGLAGMSRRSTFRTWRLRTESSRELSLLRLSPDMPAEERTIAKVHSRYRPRFRRQVVLDGVRSVVWQVSGDPDRVMDLVREIHGIGSSVNSGYGQVSSWSVAPCRPAPAQVGWLAGGRPLRNLPVSVVGGSFVPEPGSAFTRDVRAGPPYWDVTGHETCWVPVFDGLVMDTDAAEELLAAA